MNGSTFACFKWTLHSALQPCSTSWDPTFFLLSMYFCFSLTALFFLSPIWQSSFLSLYLIPMITKGDPFPPLLHTRLLIGIHSYLSCFIKFLFSKPFQLYTVSWPHSQKNIAPYAFLPASVFPSLGWSAPISVENCSFSHLYELVSWSHFSL